MDNAPLLQNEPPDMSGYQTSRFVALFQLFVSSYSYMVTFFGIFFYWAFVSDGQHERLYGFAFSSYALATLIFSPLVGFAAKKFPLFMKFIFAFCMCCDLIGNVLYFFAGSDTGAGGITLFFFGRFLSGVAGANTVLTLTYITRVSTVHNRTSVMNQYRMAIFWGKVLSPIIGSFLLYWVTPPSISIYVTGLNACALTSIPLDLLAICSCFMLKEVAPPDNDGPKVPFWKDMDFRKRLILIVELNVTLLAAVFGLWMLYAELVPIAVITYEITNGNFGNVWLAYIPLAVGAILAGIVLRRFLMPNIKKDYWILIAAEALVGVSLLGFIQFTDHINQVVYYVVAFLLFLGNSMYITVFRSVFSKVAGNTRHLPILFALLQVTTSLGQVLAPTISGAIITVESGCGDSCNENDVGSIPHMSGVNIAVLLGVIPTACAVVYQLVFMAKRLDGYCELPSDEDSAFYEETLPLNSDHSANVVYNNNDNGQQTTYGNEYYTPQQPQQPYQQYNAQPTAPLYPQPVQQQTKL